MKINQEQNKFNLTPAFLTTLSLFKKGLDFHQLENLAAWHIYFGVCKRQGLIHRAVLIPDYYEFRCHEGGLQPSI